MSGIDEGLFLVKVQDSVLEQFETGAGPAAPAEKDKGSKDKAEKVRRNG